MRERSEILNAHTMSKFIVKSYSPKNQIQPHSFFVLNKGLNSGKPLMQPCPNSFVITSRNEDEMEFLFQLCKGLWQTKAFQVFLVGSVIPFLLMDDFKYYLLEKSNQALNDFEAHQKTIKTLRSLDDLEKQFKQNLLLIADARRSIYHRYIKRL